MPVMTLSAKKVEKKYGKFKALSDASIDLYQGEILALLGPNGAGKTTLIKILSTLLAKDQGTVSILGFDLDREPESIRHLIGYVGQDTERSAYARLTVRENLNFFATLRGMGPSEIKYQLDLLVDYFDFRNQMDKLFVTLSGGQKQTVVIMRALLHNPPIIFLDEPTKGLDPIIARKIRAYLKKYIHEQNKTMLLTSHVLSEVDEMADRVALIRNGSIPISGTPQQLKDALGSNNFIEIEKSRLTTEAIQRIQALDIVRSSYNRDPAWISFGVEETLKGAEEIIRVLREEEIEASFRHHVASLEDAFFHHMGELEEKFDR